MNTTIDGVLDDAKAVNKIKESSQQSSSIPLTNPSHSLDNGNSGQPQSTSQVPLSTDESAQISSPRPRDLASSRILGRSNSLKTHRTNIEHAVETRAHAQTASSFNSAKPSIPRQRPATSSAHPVTVNTTFDTTSGPVVAEKSVVQETIRQQPAASATSSPGLFTPVTSPFRPDFERAEASEPLSSPFLHHTHRQAPKETHLAEVDVDPVSGRKIVNHYEIISELGRGVHGKVKLGRDLHSGSFVAIKIVDRISKKKRLGRTGDQETKIKREIAILKKARHPNIVGLLEVIDDPLKKKVYIILEHAELGEVEWRIRGEPEVCFVEYRRSQRESEGVFDNEEEDRYDQHIMETAHRHLERQERRDWEEAQERRKDGRAINMGPWSLEHGTESDADPQSPSRGRYAPDLNPLGTDAEQDDSKKAAQSSMMPPPPVPQQADSTDHRKAMSGRPFDAMSTAEVQASFQDDLEGNIYGTYETQSPRDRPSSAFDSFASSRQDYLADRVPEHYSYVPTMSLSEIRRAIRDTMLGLEYLHYQGVVHRDIKPANLLQTKDHRVKISDFGVSYLGKATGDHMDDPSDTEDQDFDEALELAKTVGTPAFYAPELCRLDMDDENPAPVTTQIDIWAVGVTLYCLVFGRVPFHHDNTFALMRLIAEREVYIPTRRLQAVDVPREPHEILQSPPSQIRQAADPNKRAPHDLVYEEVSEELRDLLKRLLTKDPRVRIKLTEVKHHPWLLTDIPDPVKWLDESDPTALTQGKPIEISQEDVDVAVAPYGISERAKNIAYRVKRKVVDVLGYGKGTSRRRAKSSAAGTGRSSNASSSSTISQDSKRQGDRRQSARPEEFPIFNLKDPDHPLSRSLTTSPEPGEHSNDNLQEFAPARPDVLERGVSATGSVRTIRQRDIAFLSNSGATTAPALPSTPNLMERPPHSSDGILGISAAHPLAYQSKHISGKSANAGARPFLRLSHEDTHARPSIAISQAVAAGLVRPPSAREVVAAMDSEPRSPTSSRPPSTTGALGPRTSADQYGTATRSSSLSSMGSRGRGGSSAGHHPRLSQSHLTGAGSASPSSSPAVRKVSHPHLDEDVIARAKEEQLRRLIQEERQHQALASAAPSPISLAPCPPSPDDLDFVARATITEPARDSETTSTDLELDAATSLKACDSEEQFPPGMSVSTSNPSLPSAISANSSIGNDDMAHLGAHSARQAMVWTGPHPQNDAVQFSNLPPPFEQDPLIVGQDEEYSSDEDFLEMNSRNSKLSARRGRNTEQPSTPASRHRPSESIEISPGHVPRDSAGGH